MCTSSRRRSQGTAVQYTYTIFVPVTWLGLMIALWSLTRHTEGVMVPMLAGLPGYWLPVILRVRENDLLLAATQCVGGIPILLTLGLLQDRLRVSRAWMWAYLIGPVLVPAGPLIGIPVNWVSALFCSCMGLYAVSMLCLFAGAALAFWRRIHIRHASCMGAALLVLYSVATLSSTAETVRPLLTSPDPADVTQAVAETKAILAGNDRVILSRRSSPMRIAVPVLDEVFCEHFGRSNAFFLCDVEDPTRQIGRTRTIRRPKGKCESLPDWLGQMGITTLLVGGMGEVGRHHFDQLGIVVSVGHKGTDPLEVVSGFLAGSAEQAKNSCAGFEHRHRHCRG